MPEPIPAWQPPLVDQFISTDSSNLLIHYFGDVFDWHGYVKFLSLAALRETSRDVPLEKLFVPPHVAPQPLPPDAFDAETPPPTQALAAALAEHPRLVLLGDPGSGKSTVVNWICTALGRGAEGPLARELGGPLVPLPFILRELGIDRGFAALADAEQRWLALLEMFLRRPVAAQLLAEREKHGGNVNDSLVVKLLESGQAIVLLDGIDEIGDLQLREALREAVHAGMRRHPRARWVLTSRIVGYEEVMFDLGRKFYAKRPLGPLDSGSDGVDFEFIEPESGQAVELKIPAEAVSQLHTHEFSYAEQVATRLYLAPFNDTQVEHFTRLWWAHHESNPHLAGTKPAQFLGALRASPGARSLGRLPHLLTMIALIYRVRAELPDGRALLYSFIADAYLGTLDKERGLEHLRPIPHNVEEMARWLAAVGWHLQRQRGESDEAEQGKRAKSEVLIEREELLGILEGVIRPKPARPGEPPVTARDTAELFLEYAGRRSGLLLPRGEERYAFLHLSFQEYFAALHLRDQVTDPEWWEAGNEPAPDGSGRADFIRYAAMPAWRETLIFLWESASLVTPKLPQRLIAGLFGWKRDPHQWGRFSLPTVKQMKDERQRARITVESKRVLLAAALSVDPHVELSAEARRALWERCWPYEIAWQDSAYQAGAIKEFEAAGLARVLLSRAACLEESGRVLQDAATRAQPIALNLRDCTAMSDLSPLVGLPGLQTLDLSGCNALNDLRPLADLPGLQWLDLSGCNALSDLRPLAGLPGLWLLYLDGCTALSDLSPLAGLTGLQQLNLSGCTALSDLTRLAGLSGLRALDLRGCTGLSEAGIGTLRMALPKTNILTD